MIDPLLAVKAATRASHTDISRKRLLSNACRPFVFTAPAWRELSKSTIRFGILTSLSMHLLVY
jgi:hypothetical protein